MSPDPERALRTLDARGLDGARYALPGDLPRAFNLLMIAFAVSSRRSSTGGSRHCSPSRATTSASMRFPVLPSMYGPVRWFIDGGMRGGIPDPAARARTLTVYTDVRKVTSDLGLPGTDTIAVVLVDRDGRILAQEVGRFDEEKAARLSGALPSGRA